MRPSPPPAPIPGQEEHDLGFGSVVARESRLRLLNRDGSFNAIRAGQSLSARLSPYQSLLTMSWPAFLALFATTYVFINSLFAGIYVALGPTALIAPGLSFANRFLEAFFFSVETFGTIGYGNIVPIGTPANFVVVAESIVSILTIALSTGLIFARFSRPIPRIRYSQRAVVAPYRGGAALMFRIVNERRSELLNVEAAVTFSRFETIDGMRTRTFSELALERQKVIFFSLSWTLVHPIDATSPLYGLSYQELIDSSAEVLVMLTAVDDAFSQPVHSRTSYIAKEILWGARFTNVFIKPTADGRVRIDTRLLDRCERADIPAVAGSK
jgi:inward rectifier potassium channel